MTVLSHEAFHPNVGLAFDELLLLAQLSQLPDDSVRRILQSIPEPLLREALTGRTAAPPVMLKADDERRSGPSRKVLRGARVIDGSGAILLDVQVREISEGGCRIWSRTPGAVPDEFTIRIVGIDHARRCAVRWREGEELGVCFRD
jgi:hypothetical protein